MQKSFVTVTPDTGNSGSTTVTVVASANPTTTTRSVDLLISGGGITRTVNVSQAAATETGTITFNSTLGIAHAWLFNSNSTPSGDASTYSEMNMVDGKLSPVSWSGSLTVNNVSNGGQTANMGVGQTVYIRVSPGSLVWSDTTVHSFVLQSGSQTVNIN